MVGAPKVVAALQPSLQRIRELLRNIAQPLFAQAEQTAARILASMHTENFGENAQVAPNLNTKLIEPEITLTNALCFWVASHLRWRSPSDLHESPAHRLPP